MPICIHCSFIEWRGPVAGVSQHERALDESRCRRVLFAVQRRERLPGKDERRRLVAQRHDDLPRLNDAHCHPPDGW
jgi:hypothetical protein